MYGLHQVRTRPPPDPIIAKGTAAPKEGLLRAWAYALALAVFSLPVFNPDVFWHLSAARWILAHGTIPHSDPLSFTSFGSPWIDFEWGSELVLYVFHFFGGLWALWLLKWILLVAAFWPVDGLLRNRGVSGVARAGALALWLCAMLAQSDLRIDLISACFFAVLLRRLEQSKGSFVFGFWFFAIWANLHAGFVLGLGLYVWAALSARFDRREKTEIVCEAAGAGLGSLVNPYGLGLYRVLFLHAVQPATRLIMEWQPPLGRNPFQLPLFIAAAMAIGIAFVGFRHSSKFLLGAAFLTFGATAFSARFGAYFAASGALAFCSFPRPRAAVVAAGLAVATILLLPSIHRFVLREPFDDLYVARRAVDFVVREKPALGNLRFFNQYEWGGYLGWRLGPGSRVFDDGRYLFSSELSQINAALASAENFASFANQHRLDGFLIRNLGTKLPTTRIYPDGSTRAFSRPWYVTYFPRARWALIYWDDQALVFVDRTKVPPSWLAAHEYRWTLPGDEAAFDDARSRGEIPEAATHSEVARHAVEVTTREY